MNNLLARLSDPAKSGVYRTANERAIRDALSGSAHDVAAVGLGPGKDAMLTSIAKALAFPGWFGGNWDALEDCLSDLSWRKGGARVILFSDAISGDDLGVLLDVLGSVAESWRERSIPFYAVFVDPAGSLSLPALDDEKIR